MKNNLLMAILGFNLGIIATILLLDTGSLAINYLVALVVGGVLGGAGLSGRREYLVKRFLSLPRAGQRSWPVSWAERGKRGRRVAPLASFPRGFRVSRSGEARRGAVPWRGHEGQSPTPCSNSHS